ISYLLDLPDRQKQMNEVIANVILSSAVEHKVCALRRCGSPEPQWRHCRSGDRQRQDYLLWFGTS
ncbi:hypothetical protein KKG05_10565, partial [bacterium]|nr:hypothetical protein [bacterium]